MHFFLTGKYMFSLTLFSSLAKTLHFPGGIRLLWGQSKLIPPLCCSAGCWGGMWNGRINRVHSKGYPNNRSFLYNVQLCDLQPLWKNLLCFCDACLYRIHYHSSLKFIFLFIYYMHFLRKQLHRSTFSHPLCLVYLKLLHLTLDNTAWPKEITWVFS